ncbi:MAG: hypothetical protein WC670_19225 [Pseudolabrys sp.]
MLADLAPLVRDIDKVGVSQIRLNAARRRADFTDEGESLVWNAAAGNE